LAATRFAALHVWDTSAHLQVRLEAQIDILTGEGVASIWARMPKRLIQH
jgi:pyridoxamine 5'-phosphate oxidase